MLQGGVGQKPVVYLVRRSRDLGEEQHRRTGQGIALLQQQAVDFVIPCQVPESVVGGIGQQIAESAVPEQVGLQVTAACRIQRSAKASIEVKRMAVGSRRGEAVVDHGDQWQALRQVGIQRYLVAPNPAICFPQGELFVF